MAAVLTAMPVALAPQAAHAAGVPIVSSLSPQAGPTTGGTTVTINGSNFDPTLANDSVSFGSVLGTVVSVNAGGSQLTVTTPSGMAEGQVPVTVTADGLTSSVTPPTTTFQFSNPGPLHPLSARICDTRAGTGTPCSATGAVGTGPLAPGSPPRNVQVTGITGAGGGGTVPSSGVAAVALDLFIVPKSPGSSGSYGNVGVYPTGLAGGASNLSWVNGNLETLLIETPVSPSGQVTISMPAPPNATDSVDFIMDVQGYVADSQTDASGLINAINPSQPAICDTGNASAPQCYNSTGQGLPGGTSKSFYVLGRGGVPTSGVSAVALNVQTYAANNSGWLVVYPGISPTPPDTYKYNGAYSYASMLWNTGIPLTNHIIVPVDPATGELTVYNGEAPGTGTQVSIGVDGWFTDNSDPLAPGGVYDPNNGTLVCDTMAGTGTPCSTGTKLTAGTAMPVQIAGLGGVPTVSPGLTGVELSLTVTNVNLPQTNPPTGTYVCVYASNSTCQETDLNLYGGVPANLLVIVPVGTDGKVDLYTPTGNMDVLVAVTGYYVPGFRWVAAASRTDPPPYKGGMELHDAKTKCTAGFIGYRVIQGENFYQIMTAGHCFGELDTVSHNVAGQTPVTVGSVTSNAFADGSSADAGMVQINGSYTLASRYIITNEPNQNYVSAVATTQNVGDAVCQSGNRTGNNCGTVTRVHQTIRSQQSDGSIVQLVDQVVAYVGNANLGDSGAPVYSTNTGGNGVVADGILSSVWVKPDGSPTGYMSYSFMKNILQSLPGVCIAVTDPFNPNPSGSC